MAKAKVKNVACCRELCTRIALLLKDGEQTRDRVTEGLEPFVLENDDAVNTLHSLIDEARKLVGGRTDLVDE